MPAVTCLTSGLYRKIFNYPRFLLLHYGFSSPSVDFLLTALSKSDTSPEIFQSKFLEFCEGLQDHYHVYTDGSRMNSLVGAAAVGRDVSKILRITDKASIFTAELVTLNLALDIFCDFHDGILYQPSFAFRTPTP